jgi:Imm-5 like putative immunity protein
VIFSEPRDPRLITVRRGGTLSDTNHHLLALWAAACAEHGLHFFEEVQPEDDRPRHALEQARAWARGEIRMSQARTAAGHAMAARDLSGAARHAAYAAAQAAAVAHVAAAYAIKAAQAAAPEDEREQAGRRECQWQREQLPHEIRELVLDDQSLRNDVCWGVFDG